MTTWANRNKRAAGSGPPHPRELGATRFFARLIGFDLECPRCGKVFQIRSAARHRLTAISDKRKTGDEPAHIWNASTQRFTCRGLDGCQKSYVLGILAWDPARGKRGDAIAQDQVPTWRQLAELRDEGSGCWMPHATTGRRDMANLAAVDDREPDPTYDDSDLAERTPTWSPPFELDQEKLDKLQETRDKLKGKP